MSPSIKGHDFFTCPSYSFLVENHSDHKSRKILFDLSLRTDWRDLAPVVVQSIDKGGFEIGTGRNVSEILEHSGVELNEIEAVIWRLVVLASQTRDVKFAANVHFGDQPLALGSHWRSIHLSQHKKLLSWEPASKRTCCQAGLRTWMHRSRKMTTG